jgi:hypothetical protein
MYRYFAIQTIDSLCFTAKSTGQDSLVQMVPSTQCHVVILFVIDHCHGTHVVVVVESRIGKSAY